MRGGSWNNNWNNLRTANRNNNNPDNHNNNIGFRCASSPTRFLKSKVQAFYGRLLTLRVNMPGCFPVDISQPNRKGLIGCGKQGLKLPMRSTLGAKRGDLQ